MLSAEQFSKRLFWDTKVELIDIDRHKSFIISRVLEYGKIEDWNLIKAKYGIDEIAKTAVKLRNLDKKTLAFISLISGVPKEKFRCYINQQLREGHLNF